MKPDEAKQKLHEMLGPQLQINPEFDKHFQDLKENMQTELIQWCQDCKDKKSKGSVPTNKKYKDIFVFFRKIGDNVRAVLTKKQNAEFMELHLQNHKAYDEIRLKLGYKKSSYYSS
ncbi:MAG: hypothetical protein V1837_04760 [Candidatus Woesearchaeota archaeon]